MSQHLPRRGWLVTFTDSATVGDNPLGAHYREWTLALFAVEVPPWERAAPLPEVVVRAEVAPDLVRALPGVASVVAAWYAEAHDAAYHPCLEGCDLNASVDPPLVFLWTDRAAALAALGRQHQRTGWLLALGEDPDDLLAGLAQAVLEGDDETLGPLADALTERDHPEAALARRFYRGRPEELRASAWHQRAERGHDVLALFPEGRLVVSSGPGEVTTVWEIGTGRVVHSWKARAWAAAVSPGGDQVALALDGRTQLWPWPPVEQPVSSSPRGFWSFLWRRLPDSEPAGKPTSTFAGSFSALHYSPDGRSLAVLHHDPLPDVQVIDLASRQVRGVPLPPPTAYLAVSPDGQFLACAHGAGVSWWPLHQGAVVAGSTRPVGEPAAWSLAITPDSSSVAACCEDGMVRRWRVADGAGLQAFPLPGAARLACSPAGRFLAVGTCFGDIHLYELPDARLWFSWHHSSAPILNLMFLPDSIHLLTESLGEPAVVWNLAELLEA